MREVILKQSDQITHSLTINQDVKVEGNFDSIILAGMGGSGHPGDLLNALNITNRPLYVHRNYDLPLDYLRHIGLKQPLVIISSYSGNTEEALSSYHSAQSAHLGILVNSSGGSLVDWAKRDKLPITHIDYPGMQPRHTLLASFSGIFTALRNSGLAEDITANLTEAAAQLEKITPELEQPGKTIAQKIKGRIPVIISTDSLGFAAKNFKIQTNENAKYPAFWNTFPELNHNELVGFSKLTAAKNPNQFIALMLRNEQDHPRNQVRMDVTAQLYEEWGVPVQQFTVPGASLLEKIFAAITLGLWTTYYLALAYGIDPIPVEGVESFKGALKQVSGDLT
jgi:glucose/mannose-6-phosphate isomerase